MALSVRSSSIVRDLKQAAHDCIDVLKNKAGGVPLRGHRRQTRQLARLTCAGTWFSFLLVD
jgi:hypothetical protein